MRSRENFVSSPGQYDESNPPISLKVDRRTIRLTVGRSSHFRGTLDECLKLRGPDPRNDDNISPLAFCIMLSDSGVRPGPPIAATLGSSKYLREFFSQSFSG